MRAFHDSRDADYRAPYGAVQPKTPVQLAIDVWDAPNAAVTLRTWTDKDGEGLVPMRPVPGAAGGQRFQATLAHEEAGIVWYHFIIRDEWGNEQRYGACEGRTGGIGRLCGWEPPSFQLTVHTAKPSAPTWHAEEQPQGDCVPGRGIAQLDPAMDYPLAEAVARFVMEEVSAHDLAEAWETLRESYPRGAFERAMANLAAYDPAGLYARFAGVDPDEERDEDAQPLDAGRLGLAKGRLWCAMLVQLLAQRAPLPFCGLQLDRTCDDLCGFVGALAGREDRDCESIVRNVADAHRMLPAFAKGGVRFAAFNDDVIGIWREAEGENPVCVLVNRSLSQAHDVMVPLAADEASEAVGGYALGQAEAPAGEKRPGVLEPHARVHLSQLGSAILLFHAHERLQKPLESGLGVLAHITSLPAEQAGAPASIGAPARAFVDWLARAGAAYWQILPVNPTDEHGSPYAGISAFAGNAALLDPGDDVDALVEANAGAYGGFCEREQGWLEPYAWFMAIRQKVGAGKTWQEWPAKYRACKPAAFAKDEGLAMRAEQWRRAQFAFDLRWRQLRAYANERGVKIVGDMPIYVSADSSDVWANPGIFQLGADGRPMVVAGCPPDAFAEEGQIWGNPVYDWAALAEAGYDWWLRRLKRAFELYDAVRLDHFIGFARYYAIPDGQKATSGAWHAGPGLELFQAAHDAFGPLPVIAEDLGLITPAVRALVAACGFPGMDIVQFADGNDPLSGYRPRPEKIAYTGTHDNRTLAGYVADRYPGHDAAQTADALMDSVATCGSDLCVFPLQDLMGLGDEARMNTPGTTEGNWTWRARQADMDGACARARKLAELHNGTAARG